MDNIGRVFGWGINSVSDILYSNVKYGQLGLGDSLDRVNPTLLPFVAATQVSAGYFHSLVVNNSQIYSFGNNVVRS
jgi:alpha-tubulin suppressor-like RCC1 family protein